MGIKVVINLMLVFRHAWIKAGTLLAAFLGSGRMTTGKNTLEEFFHLFLFSLLDTIIIKMPMINTEDEGSRGDVMCNSSSSSA